MQGNFRVARKAGGMRQKGWSVWDALRYFPGLSGLYDTLVCMYKEFRVFRDFSDALGCMYIDVCLGRAMLERIYEE